MAPDARTGDPLRKLGTGGTVDPTDGVPHLEECRWTAAPLICRDTIIVGIFTIDQLLPASAKLNGRRRTDASDPAFGALSTAAAATCSCPQAFPPMDLQVNLLFYMNVRCIGVPVWSEAITAPDPYTTMHSFNEPILAVFS